MVITQTVEYALRAVAWLAQNPGVPQTTQQLCEATQVPTSYLPKVLQPLIKAGLIAAQRGLHGGYSLARSPADLTVLQIVECIDPINEIESCPLSLSTHGSRLCPLHRLLNEATALVHEKFASTTIDQLVNQAGDAIRPLCDSKPASVQITMSADNPQS